MGWQSLKPRSGFAGVTLSAGFLLFSVSPAQARDSQGAWDKSIDFDLSRARKDHAGTTEDSGGTVTLDNRQESISWETKFHGLSAKENYRPHFSYRPGEGAPNFQFAALGAGSKKYPRVMHVAVDWNF